MVAILRGVEPSEVEETGIKVLSCLGSRPSGISALSAVLPKNMVIGAVGGVSHQNFHDYITVGIRTFGLGSSLYRPGQNAKIVEANAIEAVTAYDEAISTANSGV